MGDRVHLIVERRDQVLLLRLNRPEARNALSPDMLERMSAAWDLLERDDGIRCAVLTGSREVFCAGADLKAVLWPPPGPDFVERFRQGTEVAFDAMLRSRRLTKPVIAAVEGPAIAGGTELLQGTDIRVAGESATFGVAEVRHGLFPLGGSTVRLRRQIAYTHAAELLLTGRTISAARAAEIGLIGHVVPDGTALDRALAIAEEICRAGPLAVQAVKAALQATEGLPESEALDVEFAIGVEVFGTEDAQEGPRAFAARRAPHFRGR